MEATAKRTGRVRVLRPNANLYAQSRIIAAALTLPVFAAMLWFAIPRGTWPRVLVAIAVITLAYLAAAYLLWRVRIIISADGIVENGFFAQNRRIAAKRIASAVIVQVYRGQSLETSPQLFLFDAGGELLLRMRGQFWSAADITLVATSFGVPLINSPEPFSRAQLRQRFADVIYWFERWPFLGALCLVGAIAGFSLVLIVLMSSNTLVVAP